MMCLGDRIGMSVNFLFVRDAVRATNYTHKLIGRHEPHAWCSNKRWLRLMCLGYGIDRSMNFPSVRDPVRATNHK